MKLTVDCFDLMVKMMTMNMMMMTMMTVGLEEGWIKNFLVRKVCWVLNKQYKYCEWKIMCVEIHVFKIFHMGIIKGISLKKFIVKYKLKPCLKIWILNNVKTIDIHVNQISNFSLTHYET